MTAFESLDFKLINDQFNILLLLYRAVLQRLKKGTVIKFSELMDLIPPLCYYLFSLPIKPNYIILFHHLL